MNQKGEKEALRAFIAASCGAGRGGIASPEDKMRLFEQYEELLLFWSKKMNLVAQSTLPQLWIRHFLDSAQLRAHLPSSAKKIVDLGSGAGFPGVILSILGVEDVHLVETIGKKARFLKEVAKELDLPLRIHQERIERVRGLKADVVTARALTALPQLLSYARPFLKPQGLGLFLKGEKAPLELTEARKYFTFNVKLFPSLTSPEGRILAIKNIKACAAYDFTKGFPPSSRT